MKQNKLFNILRNFMEQVNKWQATLYLNFIDFEMEFNSIHRESMLGIMKKYGVPENVIRMVKIFCEDFKCAIDNQGEIGEQGSKLKKMSGRKFATSYENLVATLKMLVAKLIEAI